MDEKSKKILDRMQALCSRQECCSSEIRKKLLTKLEGDAGAAQEILDALERDSYLDDSRYACAFAREKAAITGWGPAKIRYALASKQISQEDISGALQEIDSDAATEKLKKVLQVKWRSLRCPEKSDPAYYGARIKLIKFALSRGYDYESVSKALSELEG